MNSYFVKFTYANKKLITEKIKIYILLMRFRKYICSLREKLKEGKCTNFVLGNSGADYDSVIGALLYAFHLTMTEDILYLPLIDCPENELALRFEIMKVITEMKIDHHQFIYTEMIPNLWTEKYKFVLNDHNSRPQLPADRVHEILDHHAYKEEDIKCPHVISHCGSANTLIFYIYYP